MGQTTSRVGQCCQPCDGIDNKSHSERDGKTDDQDRHGKQQSDADRARERLKPLTQRSLSRHPYSYGDNVHGFLPTQRDGHS